MESDDAAEALVKELLDTVSTDPNGRIEVLSPWGFKVEEIEGSKYLVAMNRDEAQQLAKDVLGEEFDESMLGGCYRDAARCISTGCRARGGRCRLVSEHGRFVCICQR